MNQYNWEKGDIILRLSTDVRNFLGIKSGEDILNQLIKIEATSKYIKNNMSPGFFGQCSFFIDPDEVFGFDIVLEYGEVWCEWFESHDEKDEEYMKVMEFEKKFLDLYNIHGMVVKDDPENTDQIIKDVFLELKREVLTTPATEDEYWDNLDGKKK